MRFQSALIVIVVLAASMVVADDELDESKSIKKIELLGGTVTRDETLPGNPVIKIHFQQNGRFNDKHIHLLKPFSSMTSLVLLNANVTDVGVKEISEITNLTSLCLSGNRFTDDCVKEIRQLR